MNIQKSARSTLTALEMDPGEILEFTLINGETRLIKILDPSIGVHERWPSDHEKWPGGVKLYRFTINMEIDGVKMSFVRDVPSQKSFYTPREYAGLRIWPDSIDEIFEIIPKQHGGNKPRPRKRVRFAIQDASLNICPVMLHPWCPLPEGTLRIEDCYRGEDCWLGPYDGVETHGGLDINHPSGTPLWAPLNIHRQSMFNSVAAGDNNNRWRGFHDWEDGSTWVLQTHHLVRMTVEENVPIEAGMQYAESAGVWVGCYEHTHFEFRVIEPGGTFEDAIQLDPWILFWQMYQDRKMTHWTVRDGQA